MSFLIELTGRAQFVICTLDKHDHNLGLFFMQRKKMEMGVKREML